jgi:hypothetical protein
MAVQKGRTGLLTYLSEFVAEAKRSGLIQLTIERGALRGFQVVLQRTA